MLASVRRFYHGILLIKKIKKSLICNTKTIYFHHNIMKFSKGYLLWYCHWLQGHKYRHILDDDDRMRRDRRTPRIALKKYVRSAFKHLYTSGNEQALLNCTGCNHDAFDKLLAKFRPYFDLYTFEDGIGVIRLKRWIKTEKY